MTHTIQPGESINVLWAGSDTTKTYALEVDVVDGVAVPKLTEIKLPTRLGIYTPSQPVSTGAEPTPVRLLMLTNEGWCWLDPTVGGYHIERITFIDIVEKYRDTIKPVALYGELNG